MKNVFIRSETKYLLSAEQYASLDEYLCGFTIPDSYNGNGGIYKIENLYFDTDDNYLIRRSLEHPKYKEKLRLRTYDKTDSESVAYFEIKKKYDGTVYKRRTPIPLSDAYRYIKTGELSESAMINPQVMAEVIRMVEFYHLKPKLYLSYERRAIRGEENGLRITFDKNISVRRDDLHLENPDGCAGILPEGKVLMELKCIGAMPVGLARKLSELKIFQSSYSKYGEEYKIYLKNNVKRNGAIYV